MKLKVLQILTSNGGSSSLRLALFAAGVSLESLLEGAALRVKTIYPKQRRKDRLAESWEYRHRNGQDLSEIRNWNWEAIII
ncbi:hypothetical protein BH09VER1_BH09VER1_15040 [soil metagenome]